MYIQYTSVGWKYRSTNNKEESNLKFSLLISLTRGPLAATVMWREKPSLIHRRPSLRVFQGHPGRINNKSNLSWYVSPFNAGLVKIQHILCHWSEETLSNCQQSPPTWLVNPWDILVQSCFISSHPKPQILTSWKIYIYFHVPFKLRP